MGSLYARIFLTCCGTLFLALCAFLTISLSIGGERSSRNFRHVFGLELSLAERIYREQGPHGLSEFLQSLDTSFASRHFVVNRQGRDLVSGEDRSALLDRGSRKSGVRKTIRKVHRFVADAESTLIVPSSDGEFSIIAIARPWSDARAQFPFYLSVLIVVSVLNSLVAAKIVSSLRAIARAAERFGEGDLETRVQERPRQGEVGLLAVAFNRMADRIRDSMLSERRLLGDVSHELRSPLTRLAFALELARTTRNSDTGFNLVQKQVATLKNLVSSLLQVTRVSPGRSTQAADEMALADVVAEVVTTNGLNAKEKRCHILVASTTAAYVSGDRHLLVRALDNVVRNAIEYSAPEPDRHRHD
jgi:signal transduction histidine kinase